MEWPVGRVSNSIRVKGALCAEVIRLRVSYNQNGETLSRNSLCYLSKAYLLMAVNPRVNLTRISC